MRGFSFRGVRRRVSPVQRLLVAILAIIRMMLQYIVSSQRPRQRLAAENLFLRKQLALFQEREIRPRRADDTARAALVWLSRAFNWREALVVVKPATLIRQMALDNPTWGEERIANELLLKLGLRVSPRTVRKYMPEHSGAGPGMGVAKQR